MFSKYVDYNFTAGLEDQLDEITSGKESWIKVLELFWKDFNNNVSEVKEKRTREVLDLLNESLGSLVFDKDKEGNIVRKCQLCNSGTLSLKNSFRGGAFIGCSNYPECKFTRPLSKAKAAAQAQLAEPKFIGKHENGNDIYLKNGRFGPYLQFEKEINETSVTYSVLRIWALVCLIPLIIAWAKRLHDVGMSAWWLITIVVPLFVSFIRGDSASNRYGEYSSNERMFAKLWGAFSAFEKSFSGMGLFISKQITFSFKEILWVPASLYFALRLAISFLLELIGLSLVWLFRAVAFIALIIYRLITIVGSILGQALNKIFGEKSDGDSAEKKGIYHSLNPWAINTPASMIDLAIACL